MDIKALPKNIARVDIERTGETVVFARLWKQGFNVDDAGAPAIEEMFDGKTESFAQICAALELQKFSVTAYSATRAQALRGPVTRVDFINQFDGWHIKKYPSGWKADTRPMSDVIKTEEEINSAIAWCESNGWTVRKTKTSVRAFKGVIKPVHDASTIKAMRSRATPDQRFYDFAFDG